MRANKDSLTASSTTSGQYLESTVVGETVRAYIPAPLSAALIISIGEEHQKLIETSGRAAGSMLQVHNELMKRDRMYVYDRYLAALDEGVQ